MLTLNIASDRSVNRQTGVQMRFKVGGIFRCRDHATVDHEPVQACDRIVVRIRERATGCVTACQVSFEFSTSEGYPKDLTIRVRIKTRATVKSDPTEMRNSRQRRSISIEVRISSSIDQGVVGCSNNLGVAWVINYGRITSNSNVVFANCGLERTHFER